MTKIISAISPSTLTIVKKVYQLIIQAELYCAENIKIAEAAKLLENCYRDVNIALMNEFATSLRSTGLESELVFEAARTKWNFSKFYPGLVGGHCICVDPYYYMAYAKKNNVSVPLISKARDINEAMTNLVVQELRQILMQNDKELSTSKIGLLGLTYKSNCNDLRNSKALKLVHSLINSGAQVLANDPYLTNPASIEEQNLTIVELDAIVNCDAIIVATAHDSYRQLTTNYINRMLGGNSGVNIDIYGIFDRNSLNAAGHVYWRL